MLIGYDIFSKGIGRFYDEVLETFKLRSLQNIIHPPRSTILLTTRISRFNNLSDVPQNLWIVFVFEYTDRFRKYGISFSMVELSIQDI